MKYVYILQSQKNPDKFYFGCTLDVYKRLKEHNSGESIHTNKYKPWELRTYFAFNNHKSAECFEVYLKSCSGRAFMKKHF